MKVTRSMEWPEELEPTLRRAIRLEWISLVYLASLIILMYLVMGSSQAMRTAWIEDVLALVPAIAFLVSCHFRLKPPNQRYPYGYHRAVSIAFLVASLALLSMGVLLLLDAGRKLIAAEHPTIGSVTWFGEPIWQGWLMLPVLAYGSIGPVILGWLKLQPARDLHDKTLFADSQMNKADWMTSVAATAGVLGIGLGWWWADAGAAALISLSILHDGIGNTWAVVTDLMDREPETVDHRAAHPLPGQLDHALRRLPWVNDVELRMRESGHIFLGEVYIVPTDDRDALKRIQEARRVAFDLDWRIHELAVELVHHLDEQEGPRG